MDTMDGFLILFIFLLGILAYILILAHRFNSKLHLKGPKGLPYLGNIFQIQKVHEEGNIMWTATDWAKTYGPIFKFKLLGEEIVVLSNYEAIYEVLVTKSNDFAGRPFSFRFDQMNNGTDITFTDFNKKFKIHKKVAQLGLKQYGDGMTRIERLAQAEIETFIRDIEKRGEQPFDPRDIIQHLVLRILESLILGEHQSIDDSDTNAILDWYTILMAVFHGTDGILLDMFPWLRHFGNKTYKAIQHYKAIAYPLFTDWIERCRPDIKKEGLEKNKTLLEILLEAEDTGVITRTALFGILQDTFGAGLATTASVISTFLILMLNYPECQDQLHKEIQEMLGNRMPELSDRQNLPLMEATLMEVLRYSSIAPIGLPHKATCDTTVVGHHIPKGTQVWTNLWALHHDESYYDQPYVFDPKRFLDINGKVIPPQERKAFMPFGAGRRVCLGELLAKARLFLIITRLVQKFEFLPDASDKIPSCDMKTYKGSFSLYAPEFKLIAKPRCR